MGDRADEHKAGEDEPFPEATGQVERATRDLSEVDKAKSRQVDLAERDESGPDAEGEALPPKKPEAARSSGRTPDTEA